MKATPKQIRAVNKMARALGEHIATKFMSVEQADKEIKRMIPLINELQNDLISGLPDHLAYGGQDFE